MKEQSLRGYSVGEENSDSQVRGTFKRPGLLLKGLGKVFPKLLIQSTFDQEDSVRNKLVPLKYVLLKDGLEQFDTLISILWQFSRS